MRLHAFVTIPRGCNDLVEFICARAALKLNTEPENAIHGAHTLGAFTKHAHSGPLG